MVDDSSAEVPSFSSSQTAQNTQSERVPRELAIDENGKITEVKVRRESSAMETKELENELGLDAEFSPISPTPPNSLSTDATYFSEPNLSVDGLEDEVEGQEQQQEEETEAENIGRAIITTHISAQKMHEADFDGSFRHHARDSLRGIDAEEKMKLGGIRIMVEQVVEVEYESDNGS